MFSLQKLTCICPNDSKASSGGAEEDCVSPHRVALATPGTASAVPRTASAVPHAAAAASSAASETPAMASETPTVESETPAVASLQQVTRERFPKYSLVGVKFKVYFHTEGSHVLEERCISGCVFSSHHFLSNKLALALKDEKGFVVVPTYTEGDVQSMVTGAVNFEETPEAACCREGHEEIGLDATEIREVDKNKLVTGFGKKKILAEVTYYVGRMSSNPGPHAAAESSDDRSQLICCVPIVNDPSDVIGRRRMASNDAAGKTVMVIPMSDYLQLLNAFNRADPRPRELLSHASSGNHHNASGGSSYHGASGGNHHNASGGSSYQSHRGSYGASGSSHHSASGGSQYGASRSSYGASGGGYRSSSGGGYRSSSGGGHSSLSGGGHSSSSGGRHHGSSGSSPYSRSSSSGR